MLHRPTGLTIIITVLALVSAPILGFSEVFGSEPFLGQIVMLGTNFAPRGFAMCDGQILPINQNQSLYSLLGTTYGGDGRTSFALPDLRGRSPMHRGQGAGLTNRVLGQKLGTETVSITVSQLPPTTTD